MIIASRGQTPRTMAKITGLEEPHMTVKARPTVRKPPRLDTESADKIVNKLINENKKWIKEMAEK
jgi:hypothetical protein